MKFSSGKKKNTPFCYFQKIIFNVLKKILGKFFLPGVGTQFFNIVDTHLKFLIPMEH